MISEKSGSVDIAEGGGEVTARIVAVASAGVGRLSLRSMVQLAVHELRATARRMLGRDPGSSLFAVPAATPALRQVRLQSARIVLEAGSWGEAVDTVSSLWGTSTRRAAAAIAPESSDDFVLFFIRAATEVLRQSVAGSVGDREDLKAGLEYETQLNRMSDYGRYIEACRLAPDLAAAGPPAAGLSRLERLLEAQIIVRQALAPHTAANPLPSSLLDGATRHVAR